MRFMSHSFATVGLVALALAAAPQWQAPKAQAAATASLLPDVADVVEKLLPAVVEISVQSKNPDAGEGASVSSPR